MWEKFNVIPVHKKNDKLLFVTSQILSYECLGKIFKKLIFNRLYNLILDERPLNLNQSGYHPANSVT